MGPPGIGDALGEGWKTYKANAVPVLLGMLCAWIVGLIPVVGAFLAAAGMCHVALKAVRGQKPEPVDGFVAFEAPVDHIVIGLLKMCGVIACCVGIVATHPLFVMGSFLVNDRKWKWGQAKDECMSKVKPELVAWIVFTLIIELAGFAGIIAFALLSLLVSIVAGPAGCLFLLLGIPTLLVTLPVSFCALAHAYDRTLGKT